jgi:hypothetical protein
MKSDREVAAEALARPWTYAQARLGMKLHPKQAAVLKDLYQPGSRVLFRCGNEVGKTSHVATAMILYHCEILGGLAVSTAGVRRQVEKQLVPSLKSYSHLYPGWRFNDDGIMVKGVPRYVGFTAADQGTFQGFHNLDGPLLIILDESAAIKDDILLAAEERCNPTRLLIMGSPLDPRGLFYKYATELAKFYKQHKLLQTECTKEKGYWLEQETIDRKLAKWGPEHPIVLSSVFAEFALSVQGGLLSLREWDNCLENPPQARGEGRHAFLDFAAGGAENVLAVARGNKVWIELASREKNTMAAVGEILARLNRLTREIGLRPEEVEGDACGLGIVMIQALEEAGWPILRFYGGAAPLCNSEYANRNAEVWTEGTIGIRKGDWILPRDEELKGQIVSRKTSRGGTGRLAGKLIIESKEDMAKRGLPSPDRADAVLGAMGVLPRVGSSPEPLRELQEQMLEQANDVGLAGLPGAMA